MSICLSCNTKNNLSEFSFDINRKEASSYTIAANDSILSYLNFSDKTDSINATKGFMGTIESGEIVNDSGNVVYNMKQYDFIKGKAPGTANPSLWRQSKLNSLNGLFKVTDSIYQIRGFDLANMTLVKGKTGWIIIDPLLSEETARAGLQLANEKVDSLPVKAVIITHSHIDHFGGIRGVMKGSDTINGKIPIYVPQDFFEEAVSENVMGGNAMGRRASYMYGNVLYKDIKGTLGTGLGQTTSTGISGILNGTEIINAVEGVKDTIDGLTVEFIYTPESEAPAEMMFYFEELKAFCQSEDINHTLHNLYTLRGAKVRNGQKWSQYIDRAIYKWGKDVKYSFGSHHWPTWGNEEIYKLWENQRDLYRYIHDQTLRLANQGYTPLEISEMLHLPDSLDKQFYNRGYYGSVSHDVRAQYQLYFGWFDGNPANLHKLPPSDVGERYVAFMGGADSLIKKAKVSFDEGDYRWVAEVVNHLVFSDPDNQSARRLLADTYEQLGYMAESGPWRNFYLSGAKELRHGVKEWDTPNTASPDMVSGMTNELFFNYLAMGFIGTDQEAVDFDYNFNVNLIDVNEKVSLIVQNGVVTPRIGALITEDVTTTVTMKRADLNRIVMKETTFEELIRNGDVILTGNEEAFMSFISKLDTFTFWFHIVEP
ncbi:MBL fold metallo-hydrolase [Aquimarina sp. TRL1]|uniref:alkyl/aryl-sulfatase n=1 Tax=Aquimarina sp. (strain TRL1) TaxID=2736252 RepID=UPI00158E98C6|nr:alkyl sulfatase dimerization domain-containing protein [Aquimarina sp. TRL1]QKX03625.1 MBL fold metallo-hydrolase [Aquimarina sp. TRL1]